MSISFRSYTLKRLNLSYQPLISEGVNYLDPDESRHLIKVLRRQIGDLVHITDGKGVLYDARVLSTDPNKSIFEIIGSRTEVLPQHRIHIACSLLKNSDRLEWFIEKSIELGIHHVTLLNCGRTEKLRFKAERLQKIAIGALKQSLRLTLPMIEGPVDFDKFVTQVDAREKYIAHVDPDNHEHLRDMVRPGSTYVVLIGPEGDFTEAEVKLSAEHNFKKVSLGQSRLRSETAAIAACHILNLANIP